MTRDTQTSRYSPRLAETAFAAQGKPAQTIRLEGFAPARKVVVGIAVIALAIGAALPVRAETDDLATGLAALGALALIAGETEGNPLDGIAVPRVQRESDHDDDHDEDRDHDGRYWAASGCSHDIGPPYGNAWGYRAKHGCAPAPGHHDHLPDVYGKGGKGKKGGKDH